MATPNQTPSAVTAVNVYPRLLPRPAQISGDRVDDTAGRYRRQPGPERNRTAIVPPPQQKRPQKSATNPPKWSPEQWEEKRAKIHRLYKVDGLPLEQVMYMMASLHNFDASPSMYKTKFKEWGGEFSKNATKATNGRQGIANPQPAAHAKRTRVPASLPTRKEKEREPTTRVASAAASGSIRKPFSPRQYKIYEQLLHFTGDSIKTLFDKVNIKGRWAWDDFGFTTPDGVAEHSDTWKVMSDQCHGASSLCQVRCPQKALATLAGVRETLRRVMGEHNPWMFVYFWRIVLSVNGISHRLPPPWHSFLGSFLLFLRKLVRQHLGDKHQLAEFLSALNRVPFTQFKHGLEIVYRQTIEKFEQYMGSAHPTVLAMRSHFSRYWGGTTLSERTYAEYDTLVRHADSVLGLQDARTLALRTEYTYAAFYHAGNLDLAHDLALELWNRTEPLIPTGVDGPPPTWSRATYAYVLSSKLLAHVDRERGVHAGWYVRLKDVVLRLQGGDGECRARAAQVQEMLAHRCRLVNDPDTAALESHMAVHIRGTLPDAPAHEAVWEVEWKPDSSARNRHVFLGATKKQKAAQKRSKRKAKAAGTQGGRAGKQPAASHASGPPVEYVCPADLVRV